MKKKIEPLIFLNKEIFKELYKKDMDLIIRIQNQLASGHIENKKNSERDGEI
ncbi:MAG: hypothetical protein ACTSVC_15055 [Promethearchaeota archaeon]